MYLIPANTAASARGIRMGPRPSAALTHRGPAFGSVPPHAAPLPPRPRSSIRALCLMLIRDTKGLHQSLRLGGRDFAHLAALRQLGEAVPTELGVGVAGVELEVVWGRTAASCVGVCRRRYAAPGVGGPGAA